MNGKRKDKSIGMVIGTLLFVIFVIYTAHIKSVFVSDDAPLSPLDITVYLIMLAVVFVKPMLGLMLVVMLIPFKIKFIPYVSVREAVGWATLLGWAFRAAGARKFKIRFGKPEILLTLLFALNLTSMFANAVFGEQHVAYLASFIAVTVFYLLTVLMLDSYSKINQIIVAFILSGVISSLYGIYSCLGSQPQRMYAFSKDPNFLAFGLTLPLPYLLLRATYSKKRFDKLLCVSAILLLTSGIILTCSRSLAIIAPLVLVIFSLIEKNKMKLYTMLVVVFIGGGILYKYLPTDLFIKRLSSLDDLRTPDEMEDDSLEARYSYVALGLRTIARHPIIGIGAGSGFIVDPDTGWYKNLHNAYLTLAAESGIPALILYLSLFILAMRRQWQLRKTASIENDEELYILSTALFLGFAIIMGFNMFFSSIFGKAHFLWLGISIALFRIEENRRKEAQ